MEEFEIYKDENQLDKMKEYFSKGETKDISFRIEQLKKLKNLIFENQDKIILALKEDLGRHENESYPAEVGSILNEISFTIKNLKKWGKVKKVKTPITQFGSKSFIISEPYGVTLIIGPFNFPFNLTIGPMIGAIAAGNCVVVKPSEDTPSVSSLIESLLSKTFPKEYIQVVQGGKEVITKLINSPFDYIFFTGSVFVGKIIMEAASKNLIPVTLELGGKSPCVVDKEANLRIATKRIALGKFFNAGQICIAPDYLLVHSSIKERFIEELKNTIKDFYGEKIKKNPDFGRIINEKHTNRLISILERDKEKIIFGGDYDLENKYIEPTLLDNITLKDASMEGEIFGPILPIITFDTIEEAIKIISKNPKPLALYIFTEDEKVQKKILNEVSFGGGSINDTISHFTNHHLPFGGVGNSGIGGYHGEESFKTFSHRKSILKKSTAMDIKLLFPPYTLRNLNLLKKVLK